MRQGREKAGERSVNEWVTAGASSKFFVGVGGGRGVLS